MEISNLEDQGENAFGTVMDRKSPQAKKTLKKSREITGLDGLVSKDPTLKLLSYMVHESNKKMKAEVNGIKSTAEQT